MAFLGGAELASHEQLRSERFVGGWGEICSIYGKQQEPIIGCKLLRLSVYVIVQFAMELFLLNFL